MSELTQPRVITAMITPFNREGRLNRDGAQHLASYLVEHGSDGLVLAGTTGESATMLAEEQLDLFDVVRQAVGDKVVLLGGTGSNSTEEAVDMTREADRRGSLDGVLVVSPYYNRPSQYGINDYYRRIGAVTNLPITLYNIPVRTGRAVMLDTILDLAEDGVISAVKDATGTTERAQTLQAHFGSDLAIYSGDDALNLEFARQAGAAGAISVVSHWAGEVVTAMFQAHERGDDAEADRLNAVLDSSYEFASVHYDSRGVLRDTPNPIPARTMMRGILGSGHIGQCLPPMIASREDTMYLESRLGHIIHDLRGA